MKYQFVRFSIILIIGASSCQKLKPEEVEVPQYPDLKSLIADQAKVLAARKIEKEVRLDEKSETQTFQLDSMGWAEELSFLKEINPNQPEYVGAFDEQRNGNSLRLTLNADTNGQIKEVNLVKEGETYSSIEGTFHEDKDVYVHHREIRLDFEDGIITTFKIEGYQKMILKDTVWFSIRGTLLN